MFGATELERFVDCSSAWLFERVIVPKTIDAEADAMLRGKVAHQALYTFYTGLPKELGADRVTPENLEPALGFLERCLDDALRGGVRLELDRGAGGRAREGLLARPRAVRPRRGRVAARAPAAPVRGRRSAPTARRPSCSAGSSSATGSSSAARSTASTSTRSARAGSCRTTSRARARFSAGQIDEERRLQVPLYMLVLRDLVGIEPLGGVYRALSGARAARGMLRAEARDDLPGFQRQRLPRRARSSGAQVETARERARAATRSGSARGDVAHDPKGGECPTWCDLWTMCRVAARR